jgi:hypothetical protein
MAKYDYQVDIGGTALDTVFVNARFMKYTSGMRRGSNILIPNQHGSYYVPDKYFDESDVLLECILPLSSHSAAAEALSIVALLLSDQDLVTVSQVDPYRGQIRARVELVTDPVPTVDDFVYLFGLRNPSGFWEDTIASQAVGNPPSVTTGGDRPISDMTLTFSGPGFLEHTDSLSQVSRVTIDAGAGAGTYVVDVGAKTVKKAGADQDAFLTITQPWWMKFQPGVAQSFTSDVSVTVDWRDHWS